MKLLLNNLVLRVMKFAVAIIAAVVIVTMVMITRRIFNL